MILMSGLFCLVATVLFAIWWAAAGSPDSGALALATGIALMVGIVLVGRIGSMLGWGWAWILAIVITPFGAWLVLMMRARHLNAEGDRLGL